MELTFEDFAFAPRYNKTGAAAAKAAGKCFEESVEIRTNDAYYGKLYCDKEIAPEQNLNLLASILLLLNKLMTGCVVADSKLVSNF